MTSVPELIAQLQRMRLGNQVWDRYLEKLEQSDERNGLHLAVFIEPYLRFILDGRKTIESRFSVRPYAPYDKVRTGDFVLLKRAGGPVVGVCRVADVWFYRLDPESWGTIMEGFAEAVCATDSEFWQQRESARFATLMRIDEVRAMPQLQVRKRDRRAWVVLRPTNYLLDAPWMQSPESS